MKTTKSILASLLLFVAISFSSLAQSDAKVIAVVNKASWCGTCEANGERAMKAFMENNNDKKFLFVGNNLSNDETKKASMMELKKLGLNEAVADLKYTGMVYFFDPESKAIVHKISVAKSNEGLAKAMKTALKAVK